MADNTQLNSGTGGDLLSTDDIGSGVKVQRVKVQYGADGSATDVSTAAPLPTLLTPPNGAMTIAAGSGTRTSAVVDLLNYPWWFAYWSSLGGSSTAVNLQFSSDNTTFSAPGPNIEMFDGTSWTNRSPTGLAAAVSTGTVFYGPSYMRYVRLQTTATTTGTFTLQIAGLQAQPYQSSTNPPTAKGTYSGGDTVVDSSGDAIKTLGFQMGYFGGASSQWMRVRVPNKVNWGSGVSAGNTAIWTPASGRKFRLMRYKISIPGNATVSPAGTQTLSFQDGTGGATNIVENLYIPSTSANVFGQWSTGWVDLGNGFLSATANNVLNINLNKAMVTGSVDCQVVGTEE